MLTDLTIKHLRGLADASGMHLPDLGRTLNLLCGSSGAGKTTVLEAISLLLDHIGVTQLNGIPGQTRDSANPLT